MSQQRIIGYTGIAVLVGLALLERTTNSVELLPANVVSVTSTPANDGPDQWRVNFEVSSRNTYTTDPVQLRPVLEQGDPICVRKHARSWARTKYTLTTETSCWVSAVTPLRAPD